MEDFKFILGNRILELRKLNKLTQKEFANLLDMKISRSQVAKIESGLSMPSAEFIKEVSLYFKVTTDYILFNTDNNIYSDEVIFLARKKLKNADYKVFLGNQIKTFRKHRNLTQDDLCSLSKHKISRTHLSKIESGINMPSADIIKEISSSLNISSDTILLGVNSFYSENTYNKHNWDKLTLNYYNDHSKFSVNSESRDAINKYHLDKTQQNKTYLHMNLKKFEKVFHNYINLNERDQDEVLIIASRMIGKPDLFYKIVKNLNESEEDMILSLIEVKSAKNNCNG